MDEIIRQLPHDNEKLDDLWNDIFTSLSRSFSENDQVDFKLNGLQALTDYVLADIEEEFHLKITLIELVIKHCVEEPSPPLNELLKIFCKVLESSNVNNLLCFNFIKIFYCQFRLGEKLSTDPCIELIKTFLECLEKREFLDKDIDTKAQYQWSHFITRFIFSPLSTDENKLNYPDVMLAMRSTFQEFFKWMACMAPQSRIWSDTIQILDNTQPELFTSYDNLDDVKSYLAICLQTSIPNAYVLQITKSFQTQPDLFKTHSSQIYKTIEKLVAQDELKTTEYFINYVIVHNFKLITNFEEFIRMLIQCCQTVKVESRVLLCEILISPITLAFEETKLNKHLAEILIDYILAIINLKIIEAPQFARRLLNIKEFYPWKQLSRQIIQVVQACIMYDSIVDEIENNELDSLTSILNIIYERANVFPNILHAVHSQCLETILKWSCVANVETGKSYGSYVFNMGYTMISLVDKTRVSVDTCIKLLQRIRERISDTDNELASNQQYKCFFIHLAKLVADCIENLKDPPLALHEEIASFCLAAFDCPFKTETGVPTISNQASYFLWQKVPHCLYSEDQVCVYQSCTSRLHKLVYEENEQWLHHWWHNFWTLASMRYPNAALESIPEFLEEVIDHKNMPLLNVLMALYSKQPEPYHTRLDDLIQALFDDEGRYLSSLSYLFSTITQAHPEFITSTQVDFIFQSMKTCTNSSNYSVAILESLSYVASTQPHLFDKHKEELIKTFTNKPDSIVFHCLQKYMLGSSILHGEHAADEYLTLLIGILKNTKDISEDIQSQIFYTCQLIGAKYQQVLANKRSDLLEFESCPNCQNLINFIDGKKLTEENKMIYSRIMNEMAQIEQRVIVTEHNLHFVTDAVKHQEVKVANLDAHVNVLDGHIKDLTEQLDTHSREIDRIDKKTLSYVPAAWGRDACTILNVRANNDWRLLGKRFGYSACELKHWATQVDPAMSLLNEWFMTHKNDEATYGLLKVLNEIGRQDVEQIIRQAITAAGELIPDDFSADIKRLPPIFISYQWGSQKAVLKLKENLEQAGYLCWMDSGQMGGGDKLFAKIDAGIRGAKVIICCINKAYAQSDNCSREVHLSVSTGKPLIPLQMEKQTWPPEGALGPIMSEYLFIRFYDRKAKDENYWPADKFTELLGQIRYHVAPDPDMIANQYHNWFVPRADNLIFLQPQLTNNNQNVNQSPTQDNVPLVITHPQIMISYQWDYQNDILELYKKLTKLGYRCWLDIFQMGGGDSLFEKIDTGIRNAKCILACVTTKYSKSINCRREVALADALKIPIVPLLLEEIGTWPPSGPMAMVFAEKTYVDFHHADENNSRWSGKAFESLLVQLKQLIPEVETERPQRHLLDMQRPTTAPKQTEKNLKRLRSAPITPQSTVCALM